MKMGKWDCRNNVIKGMTACAVMLSSSFAAFPAAALAENNIAEIRITNPSGLIPVGIYPADQYDKDKNYWVNEVLNNYSFVRLQEDLKTEFSFSQVIGGTAYENRFNGASGENKESFTDLINWAVDFEQNVTTVAHLSTHTSKTGKQKYFAISRDAYDKLISNLEQFKKQIKTYKRKIDEVGQYLSWLKSLSSDDLKTYFGEFNHIGTLTISNVKGIDFDDVEERMAILNYNIDLIDRLVFGRDDLPYIWVQPANRLVSQETSIGYIACDELGFPRKYTTDRNPTIKYTAKIETNNVDYKITVMVDGKIIDSTYDQATGIISAPTQGLSVGNHTVKIYITSPDETVVPGADEQGKLPFPIVQWSFEVYENITPSKDAAVPAENQSQQPKPATGASEVSVLLEGQHLNFTGATPLIKDSRTLAPVRAFIEGMGGEIDWDPATRIVTAWLNKGNENAKITLQIDSPFMYKEYTDSSGKKETSMILLDVPSQIIQGSTYIPIRAVAEVFGYQLDWNSQTSSASLAYSGTLKKIDKPTYRADKIMGDASLLNDYERQVFVLVNEQRIKNNLSPFSLNVDLSLLARKKSQDMLDNHYFDHVSPTYGSPFEMMSQAGFRWRSAGENIAFGQSSAKAVMEDWMNSPGHRANILSADYEQIGIGLAQNKNSYYWTQQFYTPQS